MTRAPSEPLNAARYEPIMKNQRLLILSMLILYIFSPTIFAWVINPEGAWYRPFIIWGLLIAAAFAVQMKRQQK